MVLPFAMHAIDLNQAVAQSVSLAQAALDGLVDYAEQRIRFKHSIGEFEGVRFMLAQIAMQVTTDFRRPQ